MNKSDAEEYTASLGQSVSSAWRFIALAKRLGVAKALGLSDEQWVSTHLGGYVRMSVEDRRKAVAELSQEGESTREIAKVLGVSHTTTVRDLSGTNVPGDEIDAASDMDDSADAGTNVPPSPIDTMAALAVTEEALRQNQKLLDVAEKQSRKEEKAARKAPAGYILPRLFCADIRTASIEPGSIDVIITDPPYAAEYLPLYSVLSQQAEKWLRPGGSLIVMCGQYYLPEVMARISKHLTYHWTACYLTPGGQAAHIIPRCVNTFWKPLLWFVKGAYDSGWIGDVTKSDPNDNDKQHHHWGQSESGMTDIIMRWTDAGAKILDPFLGGGTTVLIAAELGRNAIGFDINQAHVAAAIARLPVVG